MIPVALRCVPAKRLEFSCKPPKEGMKSHEQAVFGFGHFVLVPSQVMRRTEHLVFMPRASSGVQAATAEYD